MNQRVAQDFLVGINILGHYRVIVYHMLSVFWWEVAARWALILTAWSVWMEKIRRNKRCQDHNKFCFLFCKVRDKHSAGKFFARWQILTVSKTVKVAQETTVQIWVLISHKSVTNYWFALCSHPSAIMQKENTSFAYLTDSDSEKKDWEDDT